MPTVSLVAVPNIDAIWPHLREGFQRSVMKTGGDIETGDLWVQCRGATSLVSEGRPGWAKIFPKAKVLRALYEEQL
jgi:hypothetical protein